jgi:Tol biopolymer transport system component
LRETRLRTAATALFLGRSISGFVRGGDVFTANPDGTQVNQVPLVYPADQLSVVVWSSDGSELLISHTFRLDSAGECCLPFRPAIVSPTGAGFTLLTMAYAPFDMDCQAWSVDQTRIFCGFGGDEPGVFSVRASDGGDPARLTTNPYGGQDLPTDASPDGTRFVFLRSQQRSVGRDRTQQVALFVENVDGTGLRQITPYGLSAAHDVFSAHWSPDGREIIFSSTDGAAVHGSPRRDRPGTDQAPDRHRPLLRLRAGLVAGRDEDRVLHGHQRPGGHLHRERRRLRRKAGH